MGCEIGTNLRVKLMRSELKLSVATKNYVCTGLPRYKRFVGDCSTEVSTAKKLVEQHCQCCQECSREFVSACD
jgi:hypothetical protein